MEESNEEPQPKEWQDWQGLTVADYDAAYMRWVQAADYIDDEDSDYEVPQRVQEASENEDIDAAKNIPAYFQNLLKNIKGLVQESS
jgi:hypothetical protein